MLLICRACIVIQTLTVTLREQAKVNTKTVLAFARAFWCILSVIGTFVWSRTAKQCQASFAKQMARAGSQAEKVTFLLSFAYTLYGVAHTIYSGCANLTKIVEKPLFMRFFGFFDVEWVIHI